MSANRMDLSDWGCLLLLSILWGGSFFFVGIAVADLPAFTLVFIRVTLAALMLHVIMKALGQSMPTDPRVLVSFLILGLLANLVPFSLFSWAQAHVASGLAAILNASTPLFTLLVAHGLTGDEKITSTKLAGMVIGFTGVTIMLMPALVGVETLSSAGIWPQLACLGAAISYAFAGVFARRFADWGVTRIATAAGQVSASALLTLPVMLTLEAPWTLPMPSLATLWAMLALGVVSTGLAYLLYFRVLNRAGATNIALVTFLVPVSAIWLGYLFLNERLAPWELSGMAVIGIGLAVLDGRPLIWLRNARLGGIR